MRWEWRRSAANYLLGGIALSLLTWFCFWLKLNLPTAAFAYLILIVLMSLRRDRGASIVLTLAAAGCLNYFFAPPTFTLWIESPSDATVVMAFLTTSLISSTLLGRSRRRTEEAISAREALEAAFRAEQAEKALHQARLELSHVTRIATLGELTASITHEVSQPLGAIVTNAEASLRWLARENIAEARSAIERIVLAAHRASAVISRTRELYKKADPEKALLDINNLISDAILLVQREAIISQVSLQVDLASRLPAVRGDRVQLQQVIINLVMNGIEAMAAITDAPRKLRVRSHLHEADQVIIAVQDLGSGIDPDNADKLFNPFFTTKPNGMGMGLSICRSIIEAHGGRVWASRNIGPGTTFQFALTAEPEIVS
jgi:C4-dicarboxylate-specific signal transduction histidine kinase